MKQIRIRAYNNDNREFTFAPQQGRLIGDIVNEAFEDPRRNGIPFLCQKGVCRSCTVKVIEGSELLEPPNGLERRALGVGKTTISKGYRLACLTRC